nr:uncharacterized protein LOC111843186 [Paramormyrops kingsleyae]
MNFGYIWRKKTHYMKKVHMIKQYKDGGLQAIDFDSINGTLKINYLKSLLNQNSFWFHIPRELFKKIGGIEFLLRCDFNVQRLPIKLSQFHQQVLLYWKILYNHNFTPHNTPLWNNRYITFKNKSLYDKDWMEKGIWSVFHLMDKSGVISYESFCIKYFNCNWAKFESVVKAIPNSIINLMTLSLPSLVIEGCKFKEGKLSNKNIRNIFNNISYPSLVYRNSIYCYFQKDTIHSLRTKYLNFPLSPKIKEIHFKILNGIYPSNECLRLRFGFDTNKCIFCDDIETTDHLFFHCMYVEALWLDIHDWLY